MNLWILTEERPKIEVLQQIFASIGVEVILDGNLPASEPHGRLIADIAREAVTNAVRHGFATQVQIKIDDNPEGCRLRITNNGHPAEGTVKEGEGLRGMRKKVEPFGGILQIDFHPQFVLTVELPN